MKKRITFRPDLSDYEIYVESLVDKLNEDGLYTMNKTDAVKLAIEQACKRVLPDVVIRPKRKRYVRLDF
jgi:hypothetical protein